MSITEANYDRQDAYLETGRAPVDELDSPFRLDRRDRSLGVLGCDIATVQQTARHVLALARVALHHLGTGLEARVRHLCDGVLLMVSLVGRDERRKGREWEVDTREGDKVGLELVEIDVERAVEAQGCCDGRHDLCDEAVEVREAGLRNTELLFADIKDRLVVDLVACQDRSNVRMRRCIP